MRKPIIQNAMIQWIFLADTNSDILEHSSTTRLVCHGVREREEWLTARMHGPRRVLQIGYVE